MRTVKRAVIGTIATLCTLAAVFFGGVGVSALVNKTTYETELNKAVRVVLPWTVSEVTEI